MTPNQETILGLAKTKGVIRPRDLVPLGINPDSIYSLVAAGQMVKSGRGLYMIAGYDVTEHHTIVEASLVQTNGVVCLLSALSFHGLGTQLPSEIWLSVPYGARIAKNEAVPIRTVVMRSPSFDAGIDVHTLEGVDVKVYNIAKTIADCFKFRNKIGLDVAIEALHDALRDRRCKRAEINKYARIDRVDRVIQPYMESLSI